MQKTCPICFSTDLEEKLDMAEYRSDNKKTDLMDETYSPNYQCHCGWKGKIPESN